MRAGVALGVAAVGLVAAAVFLQGTRSGVSEPMEAGVVPPASAEPTPSLPSSEPTPSPTAPGPTPSPTVSEPTPSAELSTPPAAAPVIPAPVVTTPTGEPLPEVPLTEPPVSFQLAEPALEVPVVAVATRADGSLELPESPDIGGWWAPGAEPGDPEGTVVIAGHVDTAAEGAGAFAELWSVPVGSTVTVTSSRGEAQTYAIEGRRVYGKAELPQDLFTTQGAPRLVLITCTGPYDRSSRSYPENLVLYAVPAPAA